MLAKIQMTAYLHGYNDLHALTIDFYFYSYDTWPLRFINIRE